MAFKAQTLETRRIFKAQLTSRGSSSPGIRVPSLEQKQYGNVHLLVSHFNAKSTGSSVIGAGAVTQKVK